ncbi:MAG: protein-disulfide reductase DsbD domain-containing protein [Pseudomonadota bacterium]
MQYHSVLTAASFLLASVNSAPAQQSDFVTLEYLPGWEVTDGIAMGGLRIRLEPGWKTYWRSPGDAGIPPQFSWEGSQNLDAVTIHWPTPEVFDTAGMRTIGYTDEVILPVEVHAIDPSQPVHIAGEASLGVCRDICIPAHVSFDTARSSVTENTPTISAALDDRPKRMTSAEMICQIEPISDGLRLTTSVDLPRQRGEEVAVIEIDRREVWISEAMTTRQGGQLHSVAELVPPNGKPFALDRSSVRLTVIGKNGAVDVEGCRAG